MGKSLVATMSPDALTYYGISKYKVYLHIWCIKILEMTWRSGISVYFWLYSKVDARAVYSLISGKVSFYCLYVMPANDILHTNIRIIDAIVLNRIIEIKTRFTYLLDPWIIKLSITFSLHTYLYWNCAKRKQANYCMTYQCIENNKYLYVCSIPQTR